MYVHQYIWIISTFFQSSQHYSVSFGSVCEIRKIGKNLFAITQGGFREQEQKQKILLTDPSLV